MSLYIVFNQISYPIGDVLLEDKITLSLHEEEYSPRPIRRGNTILLPRFYTLLECVGTPHASIEKIDESTALYRQLFETEETEMRMKKYSRSWKSLFLKEKVVEVRRQLHAGDTCGLSLGIQGKQSREIILLKKSGLFTVYLSSIPRTNRYHDRPHPEMPSLI